MDNTVDTTAQDKINNAETTTTTSKYQKLINLIEERIGMLDVGPVVEHPVFAAAPTPAVA